ncbi:MAG TPA: phosphoribosylaminoimidazolesuccinocarboxamide synthase, partial [Gelria sp.]|nr:phosphoribosylaminoimidazolesuccinocarboxamide synthase [Gelria sp.]
IIKDDLATRGLELYDIKLEFGRVDGQITLIDDISGGNMRVFKNGKQVDALELSRLIVG